MPRLHRRRVPPRAVFLLRGRRSKPSLANKGEGRPRRDAVSATPLRGLQRSTRPLGAAIALQTVIGDRLLRSRAANRMVGSLLGHFRADQPALEHTGQAASQHRGAELRGRKRRQLSPCYPLRSAASPDFNSVADAPVRRVPFGANSQRVQRRGRNQRDVQPFGWLVRAHNHKHEALQRMPRFDERFLHATNVHSRWGGTRLWMRVPIADKMPSALEHTAYLSARRHSVEGEKAPASSISSFRSGREPYSEDTSGFRPGKELSSSLVGSSRLLPVASEVIENTLGDDKDLTRVLGPAGNHVVASIVGDPHTSQSLALHHWREIWSSPRPGSPSRAIHEAASWAPAASNRAREPIQTR